MILQVKPALGFTGQIRLPASKSYSIRAFIIAMCGGRSQIIAPSDCDDAKVAIAVARAFGAQIRRLSNHSFSITARPVSANIRQINVRESGTALRFVLPLLALRDRPAKVAGQGTLIGRPNVHLLATLRNQGVDVVGAGPQESVPIRLKGGTFRGGVISIDGSVSSQFISSLLIACPQLPCDSTLVLRGALVSADYIEMTLKVLRQSGIKVKHISPRRFQIAGGQRFRGLKRFMVPSDYGLAAFLLAAAALLPCKVTLRGYFNDDFIQADGRILQFLRNMGMKWRRTRDAIHVQGPFKLKGGTFSLKDCPDLVPVMAVLGLFARGPTRLTQISHARVKESDRISDLRQELVKAGARVEEKKGELKIFPLQLDKVPAHLILDPHRDHRLAMAFTILGLKVGLSVRDIGCVSKSYPGFVRDLKTLRLPVQVIRNQD